MEIDWDGVAAWKAKMTEIEAKVEAAAREFVVAGSHAIEGVVKEKANTGRHSKGEPTSAVQGSGPNVVTGALRRSILAKPPTRGARRGEWVAQIGPTVVYGRRVELEYDYPYTGPGLDEASRTVLPGLAQTAWRNALR